MHNVKDSSGRPSGQAIRTPEQAREALEEQGISVAAFARDHELPYSTVYQVITGKKKGRRGDSHRAAVLLGLKVGTIAGAERHE